MNARPLPSLITLHLRRFYRASRRVALARATGVALATGLGCVAAACVLDRLASLGPGVRIGLLGASIVAVGAATARCVAAPLSGRRTRLFFAPFDLQSVALDVEQADPQLAERLSTIVSAAMSSTPPASADMVRSLEVQVEARFATHVPRPRAARTLRRPWAACAALAAAFGLLFLLPTLEMTTLLRRLAKPTSNVAPVTTEKLIVEPGDVTVTAGSPVTVRARVVRGSPGVPELWTSAGDSLWTRTPLTATTLQGEYALSLSDLDADVEYRVTAGRARSATHRIKVVRAPAILELRVTCEFPAYTKRPPTSDVVADGTIEAISGTQVTLLVQCTEPLASATLMLGNERIAMRPSGQQWQARWTVRKSSGVELELQGTSGMSSRVAGTLSVRALPDREPVLRMLSPGEDLRLGPRDRMGLAYQAIDDFGLASLSWQVVVNGNAPRPMPIELAGDSRRAEGQTTLDLATLGVRIGDVVAVSLAGTDGAADHRVQTEWRYVLISGRVVDAAARRRIAALRQLASLAGAVTDQLEAAQAALERLSKESADAKRAEQREVARRALLATVEACALARQSGFRAMAWSAEASQADAVADAIDRVRSIEWAAQRAAARAEPASQDATSGEGRGVKMMRQTADAARQLASDANVLADGEQAAAVLTDRENIATAATSRPADRASGDRLRDVLKRARQEVSLSLDDLGLGGRKDIDGELARRVDMATKLARSRTQIDWERAAGEWSRLLARPEPLVLPLAQRLDDAAAGQSLRPDGDQAWAGDLQLASKAVGAVSARVATSAAGTRPAQDADELPVLLGALLREHEARANGVAISPDVAAKASMARSRLKVIAGHDALPTAEGLAIEASALGARRQFDAAASADRLLAERVGATPAAAAEVTRAMDRARAADELAARQGALASDDKLEVPSGAARQGDLWADIARAADAQTEAGAASGRRAAQNAVAVAQDTLARLPQQMPLAQSTAEAWGQARERALALKQASDSAPADQQAVARRSAQEAQVAADEARAEVELLALRQKQVVDRMASDLAAFDPETAEARAALSGQLAPAMAALSAAMRAGDGQAVARASATVREHIETAQDRLAQAQLKIVGQDPLSAARWFAEEANSTLKAQPADVRKAKTRQEKAQAALDQAFQDALREAATRRLAMTPQFAPVVGDTAAASDSSAANRRWNPQRSTKGDSAMSAREGEAAGYEESLRLYFQALGRSAPDERR